MDVKNKIKHFIATELLDESIKFDLEDTTHLIETGIIDSLGIIKILEFLEETFSVKVNGEQLVPENFENILCVSQLVEKKIMVN